MGAQWRGGARARLQPLPSSSCRTPIRYPLRLFVLPDSDPVPTVGRGPGAATTTHTAITRTGVSCGRPMAGRARLPRTTLVRRAGLRSGTHGGARVGRANTTTHTVMPDPLPRLPRLRSGAHHHSPYRRSIVVPDSDPVPTVGRGPRAATTTHTAIRRTGVSCGRPVWTGAATTTTRLATEVSSYRTPIRYPRWGAGRTRLPPHTLSSPATSLVSPDSDRGPTPPLVLPTKCRLAGLRSGIHGGARDGRGYHHTHCHPLPHHSSYRRSVVLPDPDPVTTPPIRLTGPRSGTHGGARDGRGYNQPYGQTRVRASLVGAQWGRARLPRTTLVRLAGPRSGTHGGARAGRGKTTNNHAYGRLLWAPSGDGRGNWRNTARCYGTQPKSWAQVTPMWSNVQTGARPLLDIANAGPIADRP